MRTTRFLERATPSKKGTRLKILPTPPPFRKTQYYNFSEINNVFAASTSGVASQEHFLNSAQHQVPHRTTAPLRSDFTNMEHSICQHSHLRLLEMCLCNHHAMIVLLSMMMSVMMCFTKARQDCPHKLRPHTVNADSASACSPLKSQENLS